MASAEIRTYRDGDTYWAEASGVVDIPIACAWQSLDRLLMRIIEMPASGESSVKLRRSGKDVPLMHVGNELVARAAMLGGVIKASMSMKIKECIPPEYLRLDVRTYNMTFAIVDFRIESVETSSRMTFRQGFRSRKKLSSAAAPGIPTKARAMPETERIFDLWVECARAIGRADDHMDGSQVDSKAG